MSDIRPNGSSTEVEVAVIGAGIGGLSAVLALRAAGVDAHVFERAPAIAPLGAAIVVRNQSVELMRRWVDMTAYHRNRVVIDTMEFHSHDGTLLDVQIPGEPGQPDWAHVLHRADLFDTLRAGVPDEVLHLGREARAVVQDDDGVEVGFADGATVRAHAVVGADGIRSLLRATLVSHDEPVFSGVVAHRSVVAVDAIGDLPNDRVRNWLQGNLAFSIFPVRGGREVAYDAAIFGLDAGEESWTTVGDPEAVLAAYTDFDPIVSRVVRAGTGPVTAFPIYDRDPIDSWTAGRVTLLGDAAHPMLPFQGQGANQAIQDGAALADVLAPALHDRTDVNAALRAYENIRKPRTAHFQRKSRNFDLVPGLRTPS